MRRADAVAKADPVDDRRPAPPQRAVASRARLRWLLGAVLGVAAAAAIAQALPPSLAQPAERLSPTARAELAARQSTLGAMDAGQRDDVRQRIAQWDAQPLAVRAGRRAMWQAWQALPADERQRVEAAAQAWRALPPDQQQALRARYDDLDASERRGWLLGPTLGADYPRLHPLLAQLPIAQRDAVLRALRDATPAERADLAVLAQRTPPQDRDALRTQWLAVASARRADWLRVRLVQ